MHRYQYLFGLLALIFCLLQHLAADLHLHAIVEQGELYVYFEGWLRLRVGRGTAIRTEAIDSPGCPNAGAAPAPPPPGRLAGDAGRGRERGGRPHAAEEWATPGDSLFLAEANSTRVV